MFNIDEMIDAFRRRVLDIDCKRMVLSQNKEGSEHFEGPGYIRQAIDGKITFKIYVAAHNANPFSHLDSMFKSVGKLHGDESFFDLEAIAHDGMRWTARQILPKPSWDAADMTVLLSGDLQSMKAHLDMPQSNHNLRLHFFEKYEVPLSKWSMTVKHGNTYHVKDRAEFAACGAKFEVWQPEDSAGTIVELTSEAPLPIAFDLRIQEALQYLTGKSAFWGAKLQSHDYELQLELSSPRRRSARTQFSPPISPGSLDFLEHGWRLFEAYLKYVTQETHATHWNPVAYHLYSACETTANSVDAWAIGISVATEAVADLIPLIIDEKKENELAAYQERVLKWLADQSDLSEDMKKRAKKHITDMGNKRAKDTLYGLASIGRVEKNYIDSWTYLRNKHVHPKIKDIKKPTPDDIQKLLNHIHKVEVLLRQLTFHLIGYKGPFTDYGQNGCPSKQYPLTPEISQV